MRRLLIITLVVLFTGCVSQKHVNPHTVILPKDQYKNDIKLLEKVKKLETNEIKIHKKNVSDYNKEIKHLKKLVKLVK